MTKKRKIRRKRQGEFQKKETFYEPIDTEGTFTEFLISTGLNVLKEEIEAEIKELCGARYKHIAERVFNRWGKSKTDFVLGGKKVNISYNRVRNVGNNAEKRLKTVSQFKDTDPLKNFQAEQMIIGVSTRKLKRSFEIMPKDHNTYGYSKSNVSRNFIIKTKQQLLEWINRPIKSTAPILMIDGIVFKETTVIIALGIDNDGSKEILSFIEGSTENKTVCIELVNDLISRGLKPESVKLAVLDGGKAINSAVKDVFGKELLIQRCQNHKKRNVTDHLPKYMRPSVSSAMSEAYASSDYEVAKKLLLNLKRSLNEKYPRAAKSLEEGLEETLTLLRIGIPKELQKSLCTTNIIESMNSSIKNVTRRVKRWRSSDMVARWVFSGIMEAKRHFRKINGAKNIDLLLERLYNYYSRNIEKKLSLVS